MIRSRASRVRPELGEERGTSYDLGEVEGVVSLETAVTEYLEFDDRRLEQDTKRTSKTGTAVKYLGSQPREQGDGRLGGKGGRALGKRSDWCLLVVCRRKME